MNEQQVLDIAKSTVTITMMVAAPALISALAIGVVVSVLQAATQVNEQTLSFIPKVVFIFASFVVFGPWIIHQMTEFTIILFDSIATVGY